MKKKVLLVLPVIVLIAALLPACYVYAKDGSATTRTIDPLVSTDWLAANSGLKDLVIIDMRSGALYGAGHIPNAINIPFDEDVSVWVTKRDNLALQVPDETDLFKAIGSARIKSDSRVVIVNDAFSTDPKTPPSYARSYATRVAETLIYAGVKNVAILDGGHTKWVKEGRTLSTDIVTPMPVTYRSEVNKAMFVSRHYVKEHIGKAVIIDARNPEFYFGATVAPFALKPGHIPTAKSLPTVWIWSDKDGTYKPADVLEKMAAGVVGKDKSKEIIVYCGRGNNGSGWLFVLTQILGYDNVKFYVSSSQEWVRYYDMVPYQWD
ncbi:MAG: rhodanese-like domain-containing protein [Syntrophales bacterium]|jgi:thiosulfate/3-mercaptopyruvate sulfurtransferase